MASSGFSYKPLKAISISPDNAAQVGSFGEIMVAQLTPTAQGDFVYNINDKIFKTIGYAGGGAYQTGGMAAITSSTSVSGSGAVRLRRSVKYSPGQGSIFRGTAIFSTGTVGNTQLIGMGNGECGYFMGYLNQNFAILHQDTSTREIRKLTITTAANSENVTVTLDGKSVVIPVVGGNDVTQTAYQLALGDYTQVGDGWDVDVIGSDVYFLSARAGPYTGSYSAVKAGPISLGTFTQVSLGVAPSSAVILQSNWNIDKMDGTGPSGMTLNPQKGNVYQIGFQYLGQGEALFAIEDGKTGVLTPVHRIKNSNSRTTPVLKNPNLNGLVTSTNIAATNQNQSVEVRCSSMATFIEGNIIKLDPRFSYSKTFNASTTASFLGLFAIKINSVYQGQNSFADISLSAISGLNASAAAAPKAITIGIFVDSVITGDVNFVEVDSNRSTVSIANLSDNVISPNTTPIFSFALGAGQAANIDLESLNLEYGPGRIITIAYTSTGNPSGNAISLNWFEKQ